MLRLSCFFALSIAAAACSGSDASTGEPIPDGGIPGSDGGPGLDAAPPAPPAPTVMFPRTGLDPEELAVIVNDKDPLSVAIADYYVTKRKIPAANVVHIEIDSTTANSITDAVFEPLKTKVDTALATTKAQAMLLTWTKPFAVDNMSITSAFAIGYKAIGDTCNDPLSQAQNGNPYLKKPTSTSPFTDLAFRPAMTLPATKIEEAQAIIDHGVASDNTMPKGTAYLMDTTDQTRSARCVISAMYGYVNECQKFLDTWDIQNSGVDASIVMANSVMGKTDVLFYVQGLASVPDLSTNTYLPGAMADHLTSYGGQIPTSGQMSAFEFLKAGATGSYGTVVEPCAFQEKFPNPQISIPTYFGGATLIEAYWKSVAWPAEGIFLGEPLARPFGKGYASTFEGGTLTIETTALVPSTKYLIEAGDSENGPFTTIQDDLSIPKYRKISFAVPNATRAFYRFRAK